MSKNGTGALAGAIGLARSKWESSGLTEAHAKKLKLDYIPDAFKLAANFMQLPALRIPYWDAKGKPTKFYRIRYLAVPSGMAGLVSKPQRYAQPAGTMNEVYMPPLLTMTWEQVAKSVDVPITITEGELKAAAGCAHGIVTLGLGGVDVWRSAARNVPLFSALEDITWDGRDVFIAFDSDAATNPNVVRAQLRLARELTNRGAFPNVISIPAAKGGEKQGMDDFLLAHKNHAVESWEELVAEALPSGEAQELWQMNTEVSYIRNPGLIIVRDKPDRRVSASAFKEHAYSNRHFFLTTFDSKGREKLEKKPLAPRWLTWERRFELEKIVYEPGLPQITAKNEFNAWEGWGCEPKKGDIKPWKDLLTFLFRGRPPKEPQWLERWLAYPLQNPGAKLFSSPLIWGIHQGTGKSLIGYTMIRIYGKNGTRIENRDIHSSHNEWAQNKQFVLGDEITGSGIDKRTTEADRLKGIISQERIWINVKYVPSFEIRDCINYYFTSNHPDAFFLEDKDRRFFIHEVVGGPAPFEFYKRYDAWVKSEEGPSALFHHLLNLDLGDFEPNGPALETDAKRAMINDNKTDLGIWVQRMLENPKESLHILGEKASSDCDLFTNAQLLRAFDPEKATRVTENGLGRELKRAGIQQANGGAPVRVAVGTQRLYIVRNPEKWLKATQLMVAKHWNDFHGPSGGKLNSKKP